MWQELLLDSSVSGYDGGEKMMRLWQRGICHSLKGSSISTHTIDLMHTGEVLDEAIEDGDSN